jgi:hypothetical protein
LGVPFDVSPSLTQKPSAPLAAEPSPGFVHIVLIVLSRLWIFSATPLR